jgi:hypothetical protein
MNSPRPFVCFVPRLSSDVAPSLAILRAHEGIRIGDLSECFDRMSPGDHDYSKYAYIVVKHQEYGESNVNVRTVLPSAQDDSSESGDESDADDPDESDSGAGGAGLPDSSEPDDSDSDDDDGSENGESDDDDSGESSESDDGNDDGENKSGEDDQVEDPSVAAVLQLPELLLMIISEVPREARTSLRHVSKH